MQNDEELSEVDQDTSREVDDIVSPNELELDAIQDNRNRVSKRDQQQAIVVNRFKYVAGVPSDSTIMCSVSSEGTKNNHITRIDVIVSVGMLGRSKHVDQRKNM